MSTKVQVEYKPPMACLGTLTSVSEPKLSKAGSNVNIECSITPDGGGREVRLWLTFRPEYLSRRFKLDTIASNKSAKYVYDRHIGFLYKNGKVEHVHPDSVGRFKRYYIGDYVVPTIVGVFGEDTAEADRVTNEIAQIEDSDAAVDALYEAIKAKEGITVGYFMTQKVEDSKDEVNPETGRPERVRTPYYEFSSFFIPTEKNLRKIQKDAEKANAKRASDGKRGEAFVVTFDADVPFRSAA